MVKNDEQSVEGTSGENKYIREEKTSEHEKKK